MSDAKWTPEKKDDWPPGSSLRVVMFGVGELRRRTSGGEGEEVRRKLTGPEETRTAADARDVGEKR